MTQSSRAELAAAGRKKLEEFRRQKANKANAINPTIATTAPEQPSLVIPQPPEVPPQPPIIQQYDAPIKEETTIIPFTTSTTTTPQLDHHHHHHVDKHKEPKPSIFGDYFAINPTNISSPPSSRQPIKDEETTSFSSLPAPPPLFVEPSLTTTTISLNDHHHHHQQQQQEVDITHNLIVPTNETVAGVDGDGDIINKEKQDASSSSLLNTNHPPAAPISTTTTTTSSSNRKDDFKALQQHIGELTEEKFMLQRGLEQQAKLAGSLADENERLAERCNEYASEAESLRGQVAELSCEVGRAAMLLEMARGEKDAAVAAASEAGERARAMAAEVVGLEEKLLKAKAQVYREKHANDNDNNTNNNNGGNTSIAPPPPPPPLQQQPQQQQQPSQVDVEKQRKELEAAHQATTASLAALTDAQHQLAVLEKERDRLKDKVADLTSAMEYQAQQYDNNGGGSILKEQVVHTPDNNSSSSSIAAKSSSIMASKMKEGPPPPSTILSQHHIGQYSSNNEKGTMMMMMPPEWICLLPESLVNSVVGNNNIDNGGGVVQVAESVNALLLAVEKDKRRLIASLHAKQADIDELESTAALMQGKLEAYQHRLELKSALERDRGGE